MLAGAFRQSLWPNKSKPICIRMEHEVGPSQARPKSTNPWAKSGTKNNRSRTKDGPKTDQKWDQKWDQKLDQKWDQKCTNLRTKSGTKSGTKNNCNRTKSGTKNNCIRTKSGTKNNRSRTKNIYSRTKNKCGRTKNIYSRTKDGPKIKMIKNKTKSTLVQLWSVSCPSLVHLWSLSGLTLVHSLIFLVQHWAVHNFFFGQMFGPFTFCFLVQPFVRSYFACDLVQLWSFPGLAQGWPGLAWLAKNWPRAGQS